MIGKTYITIAAVLLWGFASAQSPLETIKIHNQSIELSEGKVVVRFDGKADKKMVGRNESLWLMPVITDGTNKVALNTLIIRGRIADISTLRRLSAAGEQMEAMQTVRPGEEFSYHSQAEYQWWMSDARIEFETLTMGCCNTTEGEPVILASAIIPKPAEQFEITLIPEPEPIVETTGETLERNFPFVLSASEFDPANIVVYDEDRRETIIIYYKVWESVIREDYMSNRQMLINLEAAVKLITESKDSEVKHIVIGGFASPEGPFEVNNRLGFERAVSVKEFLINKTSVDPNIIVLYNGSADWRGLTMLVEASDMPDKEDILHIIRTMPVWDAKAQRGRMGQIMLYKNGRAYNYMKEHFFPKLRNGAFIRVYYDNINQTDSN